jgi:hypothetical protein
MFSLEWLYEKVGDSESGRVDLDDIFMGSKSGGFLFVGWKERMRGVIY